MPQTSDLAAMVPVLRRHAFLFTGSREQADQAVETCLRLLPLSERRRGVDRPTLLRRLHDALAAHAAHDEASDPPTGRLSALLALPPMQRKLLLLVSLEQMPLAEAAAVAGLAPVAARRELLTARSAFNPVLA